MSKKRKVVGFYTDEQKRIRPLTEFFDTKEQQQLQERKEELKQKIEEKESENAPWMRKNPFTKEQVEMYNYFSYFDSDINNFFNATVEATEQKIREKLAYYGVNKLTPEIEKALYYYRKALYESYLEEARARSVAPSIIVVGRTNYRGDFKRAERIREKAQEKIEAAKKHLENAVNEAIKGKMPPSEKTGIKIGQLSGVKLKKDLGAERVIKNFHYKHKDGTETFQYIIVYRPRKWYVVGGDVASDGTVYRLSAGSYSGAPESISANSYDELIQKLKHIIANAKK